MQKVASKTKKDDSVALQTEEKADIKAKKAQDDSDKVNKEC